MAIRSKNGRTWTERSSEEIVAIVQEDLSKLSPEDKEVLKLILKEMDDPAIRNIQQNIDGGGPIGIYDIMREIEYKRPPVDIETFVKDDYYLGESCKTLYPKLLNDLKEIFSGDYKEVVFTGGIGVGKCVMSGTEVYNVGNGTRRIVDASGELLTSSIDNEGKIVINKSNAFPSGRKKCLKITTSSGNNISLSYDHKIFTDKGWVRADKITDTHLIATPRFYPDPVNPTVICNNDIIAAAYLLADGGVTTRSTTFTNANIDLVNEFNSICDEIYNRYPYTENTRWTKVDKKLSEHAHQNTGKALSYSIRGLAQFKKKWRISGHARDKRIPSEFYGLTKEQIGLFLNRFWACDGYFENAKKGYSIGTGLASEKMIDDLRFLFLRLGIHSRKRFKWATYTYKGVKKKKPSWILLISGIPNFILFNKYVGKVIGKEKHFDILENYCNTTIYNTNTDIVPIGKHEIRDIWQELGGIKNGFMRRWKISRGRLGRERFKQLCETSGYKGEKRWLADSDIYWDEVKSIEDIGKQYVYDLSVDKDHNFIGNNIILHNTFAASICICYVIYQLSCLRDIHNTLKLAKGSDVTIAGISVNEELAIRVVYENIAVKIAQSSYFKEHFPFQQTKREFRFPDNLQVTALSTTDTSALGRNILCAILDEGNFFEQIQRGKANIQKYGDKDKARFLYDQLTRRIKSRFLGKGRMPGMSCLVSSKRTKEDFISKRISEGLNDSSLYVVDYNLWTLVPERFGTERFKVLVGNDVTPSRVLKDAEVDAVEQKIANDDSLFILEVPKEYEQDFNNDVDGSLRDIGGVEVVSVSPFIQQRDKLEACIDKDRRHPFQVDEWDQTKPGDWIWDRLASQQMIRDGAEVRKMWTPLHYPDRPRHIHMDMSLNTDCTGICCGCLIGIQQIQRRNLETHEIYTEMAPVIWIDFMLRIKPPVGGEIDHSGVRNLVYQLQTHGFHIGLITADQAQSGSSMQIFKRQGILTDQLSVDRPIIPYDTLKSAIYEQRIRMYKYEPVLNELRKLQIDRVKNKVDHIKNEKKDVSDALCGVVYSLTTRSRNAPGLIMKGISTHIDPELEADRRALEAPESPLDTNFYPNILL